MNGFVKKALAYIVVPFGDRVSSGEMVSGGVGSFIGSELGGTLGALPGAGLALSSIPLHGKAGKLAKIGKYGLPAIGVPIALAGGLAGLYQGGHTGSRVGRNIYRSSKNIPLVPKTPTALERLLRRKG